MRLIRWQRVGQSGQELVAAILFSFVIHGLFITALLFFSLVTTSKLSVPISYQVMLVSAPTAVETTQPQDAAPQAPNHPKAPAQKKAAPKARTIQPRAKPPATVKSVMPDLSASKAEKKKIEEPEATTEKENPAVPMEPASPAGAVAKKEAVVLSAGQQYLPGLSAYLPLVREKISRNWNPPPGVREAKSKVTFRILRSGRVGDVKLQESSGNFYFDQAANRSILTSSPFPQLPDEYPREYLEISVDLAEKN